MTIHYHGLPLTPEPLLLDLAGKHVCISFATKRDAQVEIALRLMQSNMFDCGEYSFFRQGGSLDRPAYYTWVQPMLRHPNWAVVPDRIGGSVDDQRAMVSTWPFPKAFGAPVWHLGLPIEYLLEVAREWPRVCFGSSEEYWQVGSSAWRGRMHEAFGALADAGLHPHIHGLRMMNEAGKWPLIEDGSLCWWSNVGITYFERDSVGPHWRWTDRQYAFKDRWWNVCYKQRDAYMTVPVFPEFGEGFSVTLGTRTRHGFDDHRPTKTFPDWRKVTKAQMLAFFDECVASRPSRPTPPFIGEAKE